MKKIAITLALLFVSIFSTYAQDVEMATELRSSGKIWVVVSVALTLFIGLFIYMFTVDKRIKKLENDK